LCIASPVSPTICSEAVCITGVAL